MKRKEKMLNLEHFVKLNFPIAVIYEQLLSKATNLEKLRSKLKTPVLENSIRIMKEQGLIKENENKIYSLTRLGKDLYNYCFDKSKIENKEKYWIQKF